MGSRLELHALLENILGSKNVYYQPPPSLHMEYPAIVYSRSNITNDFADDFAYKQNTFYEVTVIDENPDSEFVAAISRLPFCRYDRHYPSDNLNHDVFTLHY